MGDLRHVVFVENTKLDRAVCHELLICGARRVVIRSSPSVRTCIRLGCEDVVLVYRRSRSEMPAHMEEIHQAEEEGVTLRFLTIPKEVVGSSDGRITGQLCLRAELGQPDGRGRRRPFPVEGSEHLLKVDAVIPAIGQAVQTESLVHHGKNTHPILVGTVERCAHPTPCSSRGSDVGWARLFVPTRIG
jgi:hypothetical protein